jgi:multiple sugar transport system substrate-binding protein
MKTKTFRLAQMVCAILGAFVAFVAHAQNVDWKTELKKADGKTLRIIMIQDPWVKAFDTINKEFTELTGAQVIIDSYSYDDVHQKEVLMGNDKSDSYDIVVLDSPWVGEFQQTGYVEDLKPYIEKDAKIIQWDDFVPSFREVADWKGSIVGIPFGAYFVLFNYRTDLFEKAGLKPPQTIEDMKKAAATFTNNPDFKDTYGIAMNNQRGAAVGQAYFEYIYNFGGKPFESMYPGSPDVYGDMTPLFTSPESIAVVQFFKDLLPFQPPGALNMAWDQRANAFATGRLAMACMWSVREPLLSDPNRSRVNGKFSTQIFPNMEGKKSVPPLGGWVMGINSVTKQKDLAWDYIKWFTSPEIHKKFVLLGGPPSRLSAMQDPEILKKNPWVKTVYESQGLTFADCRPRIPESFQIIDKVGLHVSEALSGKVSIEDAMKATNQEVGDLLKKAGYKVSEAK